MTLYINKKTGASYTQQAIVERIINPKIEELKSNKFDFACYLEAVKQLSEEDSSFKPTKVGIKNGWDCYCTEKAFNEMKKQFFKIDTDNIDFEGVDKVSSL